MGGNRTKQVTDPGQNKLIVWEKQTNVFGKKDAVVNREREWGKAGEGGPRPWLPRVLSSHFSFPHFIDPPE